MVTSLRRTDRLAAAIAPFLRFFNGPYAELVEQPDVANFAVGNPQEIALPAYVDAVRRHLPPQDKDWFGYKMSEPNAQHVVAESLSKLTGQAWDPRDVQMTNGGFAAIALGLRMLLEPRDEVVYLSPPWFFYEMLTLAADGVPLRVPLNPPRFELELEAIDAAINERTRIVILNSPNNPTGRVYGLDDLRRLADVLDRASARIGRQVWLLSDEPYRRILFDGVRFHSPAEVFPHTLVTYSYGKQLLAPGMRIGYLTWPPSLDRAERERLRDDAFIQQSALGWAFPNADLQHAIADLEPLVIDLAAMEQRRDRMVGELRNVGYQLTVPEGTFYIMARSPIEDDEAFCRILNRHRVLVLPGTILELPGWFRISLTASDEMVERGLPGFRAAYAEAAEGRAG